MSTMLYSKNLFQPGSLYQDPHKCVNMMTNVEQYQTNTYLRFQTITSLD